MLSKKQQAIRNRQVTERDAMLAKSVSNDSHHLSKAVKIGQLVINNLLNQNDIDLLTIQLTKASEDEQRVEILARWYDWVEADTKAKDILEQQNGYPGNHLTVSLVVAKAELLRERLV